MFLPNLLIWHGCRKYLSNVFSIFNASFLSAVVQCVIQSSGNLITATEMKWGQVPILVFMDERYRPLCLMDERYRPLCLMDERYRPLCSWMKDTDPCVRWMKGTDPCVRWMKGTDPCVRWMKGGCLFDEPYSTCGYSQADDDDFNWEQVNTLAKPTSDPWMPSDVGEHLLWYQEPWSPGTRSWKVAFIRESVDGTLHSPVTAAAVVLGTAGSKVRDCCRCAGSSL
ncbi:hypothetical protein STEG23_035902 [Scotinomys teguina]